MSFMLDMKIQVTSESCTGVLGHGSGLRVNAWHRGSDFKGQIVLLVCWDFLSIRCISPLLIIVVDMDCDENLLHKEQKRQMNPPHRVQSSGWSPALPNPDLQPAPLVNFPAAWYVTLYLRLKIANFTLNLQQRGQRAKGNYETIRSMRVRVKDSFHEACRSDQPGLFWTVPPLWDNTARSACQFYDPQSGDRKDQFRPVAKRPTSRCRNVLKRDSRKEIDFMFKSRGGQTTARRPHLAPGRPQRPH